MTFTAVDPRLDDLAGKFIMNALPRDSVEGLSDKELGALCRRLALAMQQAVEDECTAIRHELQP